MPFKSVSIGNRFFLAIAFFEYRHSSIGPYNEVALATLVMNRADDQNPFPLIDLLRKPQKRKIGYYIFHLPVTTKAAWAAGCEMWGYPKFVADIPVRLERNEFDGKVLDPEDQSVIVQLSGLLGRGIPIPNQDMLLFSRLDRQPLRASVEMKGTATIAYACGMRLSIGPSQHEMARTLRDFGLEGAAPILIIQTHDCRSLLHLGHPM